MYIKIVVIIATVLLVILGIYLLIKLVKYKWLLKIYNTIKTSVAAAENTNLKGIVKKQYALNLIASVCKDKRIPFKAIKKLIDTAIETIVDGYNAITKNK